jgi:hypothetical protein
MYKQSCSLHKKARRASITISGIFAFSVQNVLKSLRQKEVLMRPFLKKKDGCPCVNKKSAISCLGLN